jgi:hypothetical protein
MVQLDGQGRILASVGGGLEAGTRQSWQRGRGSSDGAAVCFEAEFAEHSYGFRPGRGAKDALRRVDGLVKGGYRYIVDADLKSYFDTIPHGRLVSLIERRVSDGRVLSLIDAFLTPDLLTYGPKVLVK